MRVADLVAGRSPSAGGWWRVDCPHCAAVVGKVDRTQALAVSSTTGWWRCWRCGTSGRDRSIGDGSWHAAARVESSIHDADLGPPEGFTPLGEEPGASAAVTGPARAYLARRGVPPPLVAELGIGAVVSGKLAHRVVVPVIDDGRWAGWVARDWTGEAERRYLYPRGMRREGLLFNGAALHDHDSYLPVIVVEGVFDALPHYPHAVACLGKPTASHVVALSMTERPVVVALDGDAWREGMALAQKLRLLGREAAHLRLPPTTDPGDFSASEFWDRATGCLNPQTL